MKKESSTATGVERKAVDKIETSLRNVSEHTVVLIFGFLPVLFIPISFLPFDYGKVLFVIVALALSIIFFSLSVLRSGVLSLPLPAPLLGLWAIAGFAAIAALFSGDTADSFFGDLFEVNTAFFLVLLAIIGSLTSLVKLSKMAILRFYIYLTASAALLGAFHILRILFGPNFLTLGIFNSSVSTIIGSWNDLGLFLGLSVLLSLVALEQLPLTKWGRTLFTVGIALSLIMLAVINFSAVWWVLGLVSLVMLMYGLVRDRFSDVLATKEKNVASMQSVVLSLSVFMVSLMFIVAGGPLGSKISELTNISYLEVRPSFEATVGIARNVYSENAFFGIGPNKFVDAWRLYKDPSINQTIFWNTDFRGGNGYVTTYFVTTGMFGLLAWLAFFGLFLYAGFRMVFKTVHADRVWFFIGSSAFVAAAYLWGMSVIYLPGATVLFMAALFTSIMLAAYAEMVGVRTFTLSVLKNKRAAIVLVGAVMVVVVGAAGSLYYVGRHYTAVYTYGKALTMSTPGTSLEMVEQGVANAFAIYPNDVYARQVANYQLAKINALLNVAEPTVEQQQQFQNAVANGVNAAQKAIEIDSSDALNWSTLGAVYSVLVAAGETEVIEAAEEALVNARKYAPNNPLYVLQEAQLQVRAQNVDRARELIMEAIRLKPNYTNALNFLTELEIASGRTEQAIAATRSIITIEPNNPARYYQLAILLSANGDLEGTTVALERAVALNRDYANARYLLAIAYAQQEEFTKAIEQLEVVLKLNPDNQQVISLIDQIKSGDFEVTPVAAPSAPQTVNEPETVTENEETVTSSTAPDTPLISPVNAVTEASDSAEDTETTDVQSE